MKKVTCNTKYLFALLLSMIGLHHPLCAEEANTPEAVSAEVADGFNISLLTCGPSDAYPFTLYGHTAIRVQSNKSDIVYNYGIFSFDQPNFIWNFSMGRPLYMVAAEDLSDFLFGYQFNGRSVTEQLLNLTKSEKKIILDYLKENMKPENRQYLYNFYFNNCATKPRDIIEKALGSIVVPPKKDGYPSFRKAIRGMTENNPWYTWLCDVPLGWKTDRRMNVHDVAFLPTYLEAQLDEAVRQDNGEPLVQAKKVLIPETKPIVKSDLAKWWRPLLAVGLIIAVYALLTWYFIRTKNQLPINLFRCLLYLGLGIAGVLVWFLAIFSQHPHTFPNLNMLLFHPLWLNLVVTMWLKSCRTLNNRLYFINFALLAIYLVIGLFPLQSLPEGMWLLALLLCFDSSRVLVPIFNKKKRY